MKKKHFLWLVVIIILVAAVWLRLTAKPAHSPSLNEVASEPPAGGQTATNEEEAITPAASETGEGGQVIVGGDRDVHGCIGSAGYTWCDIKQICLRIWEQKCELTAMAAPASVDGVISVASPEPGNSVASPLVVTGEVRGNWFFEASLPVKLVDENNQEIVAVPAQAQSDWMTDKLVPFTATLNFTTMATSGYLIISKDNPSALPTNDASFRLPVKFK